MLTRFLERIMPKTLMALDDGGGSGGDAPAASSDSTPSLDTPRESIYSALAETPDVESAPVEDVEDEEIDLSDDDFEDPTPEGEAPVAEPAADATSLTPEEMAQFRALLAAEKARNEKAADPLAIADAPQSLDITPEEWDAALEDPAANMPAVFQKQSNAVKQEVNDWVVNKVLPHIVEHMQRSAERTIVISELSRVYPDAMQFPKTVFREIDKRLAADPKADYGTVAAEAAEHVMSRIPDIRAAKTAARVDRRPVGAGPRPDGGSRSPRGDAADTPQDPMDFALGRFFKGESPNR